MASGDSLPTFDPAWESELIWPPPGLRKLEVDSEKKSGVYFLMLRGTVVYVGSTFSILSRIATHCRTKEFDCVFWLPVDEDRRFDVERDWICALRPVLNVYIDKRGKRWYCAQRIAEGAMPPGRRELLDPGIYRPVSFR